MRRFYRRYRQAFVVLFVLVCLGALVYVGIKTKKDLNTHIISNTYAGQAMGTALKKTLFGESVTDLESVSKEIDQCLQDFEKQISVRMDDSEVAKCNRNYAVEGVYPLSEELLGYLRREMDIYLGSKGAFSPCIRPISELWGIEDGATTVPADEEIQKTLGQCDPVNIELRDNGIVFHAEHMAIDFGAAGKGIGGDKVKKLLQDSSLTGAVVSIGGTVVTYGDKGNGKEWHVGIQDPRGKDGDVLGVVDVIGGTIISTSGDYEKYFELDGKRYHHIFDPATGYPAESGLMSVSIISEDGFLSDSLSTACFVMGLEDGMAYAKEQGAEAIFVTTDKEVYVTDGIRKQFRIQNDAYELKKNK